MNIAKNMEAIFLAAVVLAGATTLANASASAAPQRTTAAAAHAMAHNASMPVVTVTAKRLSAAEKAALSHVI